MAMKTKLDLMIREAVESLFGIPGFQCSVDHPELSHGDYATNAALIVSKIVRKNPQDVAGQLVTYLDGKKDGFIESITVAGPGFINFKLSSEWTNSILREVFEQKEQWGKNNLYKDKRILVEHSSPNLFKPFHIGHVMNNTIGESIVRLAKFSGAEVNAISYPSDLSLGIGKAVWAMLQDDKLDQQQTTEEKITYLGECYVKGTRAFEEDPVIQGTVREITRQLFEKTPGEALRAYEAAKKINLEYFLGAVQQLGSYFDGGFIFESEAGEAGARIVRDNTPSVFEESDGAIVYRGEQDGLHTRVFINKEGFPTYEGKDIGLLSLKFSRFNPDRSIFITDHEQSSYFEVVISAAARIEPSWKEKSTHRTHGRMSFKGQKMSSRLGGVPTAKAVLDTVKEEIIERSSDLSQEVQEIIAIGALKFVILRTMAGKNINFDPEMSLSFEGDSGPYLQYTAVRAMSVLEKAKASSIPLTIQGTSEITDVERLISRFPDVVARSIQEWAPHYVVSYLLELAQTFNSWYGNTKIINESDTKTPQRLAVTAALQQTIRNGLWLLGISVPEKM